MGGAIRNQRGVALLMILWVVVLLMAMVTEFSSSMRLEALGASNHKEETAAYYLALAGKENALALLAGRQADEEEQVGTWVDDGEGLFFKRYEGEAGGTISIIATEDERRGRKEGYPFAGGRYGFRLRDEGAKINLNTATREVLVALLRYSGVEAPVDRDTIADSILDWVDTDRNHHLNGAEDSYYESLDPPYQAKNDKFDSPEELLLIRGMTPEILYGSPGNRAGSAPSERLLGNGKTTGIYPYLTVVGESEEINLNTAPEIVLRAIGVKEAEIAETMRHRVDEPPYEPTDLPNWTLEPLLLDVGVSSPAYFSLEAWGRVKGSPVVRRIRAILKREDDPEKPFTIFYWDDNQI
ncbi:MAG: general secretion pathway protein GspK [Candidatus Tectomicrobia bacterium]|uniref:General secretion pathway protein GspK n=1 Tax=Tectimicrobiota bacterium TaxID=2528274 RepID=A0A932CM39_UNCTE|nr:general secretion pathway protein GspK [Candidatus Tectomicrobia bacterium]